MRSGDSVPDRVKEFPASAAKQMHKRRRALGERNLVMRSGDSVPDRVKEFPASAAEQMPLAAEGSWRKESGHAVRGLERT